MAAIILDGKAAASELREAMKADIASLKARGVLPGLAVVLIGENPASLSYVKAKEKACAELGIVSFDNRLPATEPEENVLALISRLNADERVHGILVQLPLPKGFDENRVLTAVEPDKDVDGLHPANLGRLARGEDGPRPCTPYGILKLLELNGITVAGKHVVIVGRSVLVGKSLALLMLERSANATVTVCHTGTIDLPRYTRQADILVAAAGKAGLIGGEMVKEGAVVIDVGANRVADPAAKKGYRLVGDIDLEAVKRVAGAVAPVPGGVGPLTITMLLHNTVRAAASR
jgi:methylenetetrahydrofolate dehydrogenase (NADP+)/methenyltetrahydrofolate cyclohydrolase